MRLKRLELYGFKTFAEYTELLFPEGITAIVGPNGSGKSNLAEAILWVLGERSLRTLRSSQPQDLIFNGNSSRKPVGLAEVSLTIDNSQGWLPVEFSEITVTRRLHRSGDSEYLLNRQPCRLKDIVNLFLDTGIGKHISIITQTEVDAILSLRPEDRRSLLEEVAGIKKYRLRREEALRKLEQTEQNLLRLGDLMYGLELQLEPLAEQVARAQEYLRLEARAQELKLGLLIKDCTLLERRRKRTLEELADLDLRLSEAQAALAQAEAAEQETRRELSSQEEELAARQQALAELRAASERTEGEIALLQERGQTLREREEALATAEAQQMRAMKRRERELRSLRQEQKRLQQAIAEREDNIAARRALARDLWETLEETQVTTTQQREELLRLTADLAAKERQWEERHTAQGNVTARRAALARERKRLRLAQQAAAEAEQRHLAAVAEAQQALQQAQETLRTLRQQETAAETAQQRVRTRLAARQTALSEGGARLRLLEEMARSYEGFYRGVKTVLRGCEAGRLSGRYQVVADLLSVPAEYEVALEAALGGSLQDIVTDTGEQAQAAIEYLKAQRGGRATFLPLDLLTPPKVPAVLRRLRGEPGVVGLGLDLVTASPDCEPVLRYLLARVVVVENLKVGLQVRKRVGPAAKIATLEGDLILPSGALTGGSRETKRPVLLGRRREIAELRAQMATLQDELQQLTAQEQALARQRETLHTALQEAEQTLNQRRQTLMEREKVLLHARHEQSRLQAEQERLQEEEAQLDAGAKEAAAALAVLKEDLAALRAERERLERQVQAAEENLAAQRQQAQDLASEIHAEQVELARLETSLDTVQERVQRLQHEKEREAQIAVERQEERESLRQQQRKVQRALRRQQGKLAAQREREEELVEALAAHRALREDLLQRLSTTLEAARAAREQLQSLQQERHRIELRRAQIEADLAHWERQLAEDYDGLTLTEARQRAREVPNRQAAVEELEALRAQMAAMGPVNLGAIEEQRRLQERLEFLREQQRDLEQARAKLKQVIAEIDATTKSSFLTTFRAVAREFNALFRRLFGADGDTELVLTTPEDLLNTGVEVIVQLPGKRRQNLLLLSGGERALTAIALLFAMLRVKPSPFCVLDEIDAPLDDANIGKFTQLLREFAQQSQFLVITHNKLTMEVCDTLYGVTMAEPGVSQVVSYRFPQDGQ